MASHAWRLVLILCLLAFGSAQADDRGFVGSTICAGCHEAEAEAWRGSHHDLAMQPATAETVLGDFDNATFSQHGRTTRFFTRSGRFYAETDGADGTPVTVEVTYTFGVAPLQQYLVARPGGRYQVLPTFWDTRPEDEGGQRWADIHGGTDVAHDDALHWTGPQQNWNHMCASCHSTGLTKGYDADTDTFATRWAEIDVACEACHGPGAAHVAWADDGTGDPALANPLPGHGTWVFDAGATIARLDPPRTERREIETCAACHARRSALADGHDAGTPFHAGFGLALLEQSLYDADGQIDGEVFVTGSFLQSRMYAAGVTCGDCHEPHGLGLRAEGNALCAQCHRPERYDRVAHHRHPAGGAGAQCVDCHMPAKTYVTIDPRRDHSFRVPRPDLSVRLGTRNVCTGCHADKPDDWAAATVAGWRGPDNPPRPHYAQALHAGRAGGPRAEAQLVALADDETAPGIARATALTLLSGYVSRASVPTRVRGLASDDPLVRRAALQALAPLPIEARTELAVPLLDDPVRAVRLEAARLLADRSNHKLPPLLRRRMDERIVEVEAVQAVDADRAEAWLSRGDLAERRGDLLAAKQAYEEAIARDPRFAPAYVNLAEFLRRLTFEHRAEATLRRGLAVQPDDPHLAFALALSLIRQQRPAEALALFAAAAKGSPQTPRYAYAYAVALHGEGETNGAIAVMEPALAARPYDRDLLYALARMSATVGARSSALRYAERLVRRDPRDQEAQALLARLRGG